MRKAILELVLLIGVVVLWTVFAGPGLSARGMNWLNVLVYVTITAESTRLCVTGRAFFAGRKVMPGSPVQHDGSRNAAQDRAALRKAS